MEITNINKKKMMKTEIKEIYSKSLINKKISLPIINIDKNLNDTLLKAIKFNFEGKCLVEGYIKPESTRIITYSSGLIERGSYVLFDVIFECKVCFPVEGSLIECRAINITNAGIRAESAYEIPSPIDVFIARDHFYDKKLFNNIAEDDLFVASVIGQRFELNDKKISIIAEIKNKITNNTRLEIEIEN